MAELLQKKIFKVVSNNNKPSFMKRLIALTLLIAAVSCSNPEDKATGNSDSKTFNKSEEKNLNTAGEFDKQQTDRPDTSASPSTSKENANSSTQGTNRSY